MNKRKKAYLLLLATSVLALILLIISIVLMVRIGNLQTQIDELKEAKAVRKELSAKQDVSSEADTPTETPAPTAVPQVTIKPSDGTRYAYLTFDDGPSKNTERILNILKTYNVQATFFVNGRVGEVNEARYRKIVEGGHALAMHSYTHDYAGMYASKETFIEDYQRISSLIESYTGSKPKVYRFPGGSSNRLSMRKVQIRTLAEFLHSEGVEYFDWNVDSTDGEGPNRDPQILIQNVKNDLKYEHNVILMHDANDHNTTVDALPEIIQACVDNGLTFAVLDESVPAIQHKAAD